MTKNLYRIQCTTVSEFDTETIRDNAKTVTYIELIPLDGIEQTPQKKENTNRNVTRVEYKTNNPASFWAKPE
jgi:hypothetical protein